MAAKNRKYKERLRKNKANADEREKKLKKKLEKAEAAITDMPGLKKDLQTAERTVAGHDRVVRALKKALGELEVKTESIATQTAATREDWQLDARRRVPDPMRDTVAKIAVTRLGTFRQVIPIIRDVQVAMRLEAADDAAGDGHDTTVRIMKEVCVCFDCKSVCF